MTDYFKISKEESVNLIVKTCLDEGVTNPECSKTNGGEPCRIDYEECMS